MLKTMPSKDPSEIIVVSFDFGPDSAGNTEVPAGDTVTSAVVTAFTRDGSDPSPSAILATAPDLSLAPTVMQRVVGGIDGCSYLLRCVATTSPSGGVLVREGVLPVHQER